MLAAPASFQSRPSSGCGCPAQGLGARRQEANLLTLSAPRRYLPGERSLGVPVDRDNGGVNVFDGPSHGKKATRISSCLTRRGPQSPGWRSLKQSM